MITVLCDMASKVQRILHRVGMEYFLDDYGGLDYEATFYKRNQENFLLV